jgi:glutathione S-transferase
VADLHQHGTPQGVRPALEPGRARQTKEAAKATLAKRFAFSTRSSPAAASSPGDRFTIADAYLFTVVNWTNFHAIDLSPYPNIKAYLGRVASRPKVQQALRAEGLLKEAA